MLIQFYFQKKIFLIAALLTLITINSYAGGLRIHEDDLFFNGEVGKTEFIANQSITMQFSYDFWAWAGKPYGYIVFILYKKQSNESSKLVGYFTSRIYEGSNENQAVFYLPDENSEYELKYHVAVYFGNKKLNSDIQGKFLENNDVELIKQFYSNPSNAKYVVQLINLKTTPAESPLSTDEDITIYFVNPTKIFELLDAGEPLTFRWKIGPESTKHAKEIKYSFRLSPIEDWTIYSVSQQAVYTFLRPGNYTFELKGKYLLDDNWIETKAARFSFTAKKQIFGLTKREIDSSSTKKLQDKFFQTKHYTKSRALLIGVSEYSDKGSFIPLPFVNSDVEEIKNVLSNRYLFEVDILKEKTTKENIISTLNKLSKAAGVGDRIIVYFSGHGTSLGELGYLVPTNGFANNKAKTCIEFSFISEWMEKLISSNKVQHVLFILDACNAGLGVLSKSSSSSPVLELVKFPSAHMLTAGLLDQEAYALTNAKRSVFTEYLVKGLEGYADFTKDDVITLTELLVYVQNEVAKYVKDKFKQTQTPMMGKLKGAGEMIFLLK